MPFFVKHSARNGSIASVLDMLTNLNLIRVYVLCEQVSQVQGLKKLPQVTPDPASNC